MDQVKFEDREIEDARELERIFGPNWREEIDNVNAAE